mmetsp:Transcript_2824/g.17584  ORF Transcript_2824/g.17584 Transcript_2824/m.17584 type:complete len:80 (+) Transcript_2824:6290-6529(+)
MNTDLCGINNSLCIFTFLTTCITDVGSSFSRAKCTTSWPLDNSLRTKTKIQGNEVHSYPHILTDYLPCTCSCEENIGAE